MGNERIHHPAAVSGPSPRQAPASTERSVAARAPATSQAPPSREEGAVEAIGPSPEAQLQRAVRLGHKAANLPAPTPLQPGSDLIQARKSRRRGRGRQLNPKQKQQRQRLFDRRERRWREEQARPPEAPSSTDGRGDGYRQTWTKRGIQFVFSSGHGYRVNHHPSGMAPSEDITELGSMDYIEKAILRDLLAEGGLPAIGVSGTRPIEVSGKPVEYRFKRFAVDKVGIGTYYRPG